MVVWSCENRAARQNGDSEVSAEGNVKIYEKARRSKVTSIWTRDLGGQARTKKILGTGPTALMGEKRLCGERVLCQLYRISTSTPVSANQAGAARVRSMPQLYTMRRVRVADRDLASAILHSL